jgi:hypothetical protein
MFINRAHARPGKFSSTALVLSLAKSLLHYLSTTRTIRRLFADYSYYSSTICGLFVAYSQTIRTIRRLFADYSYYLSTICGLTIHTICRLFADCSYYSSTISTIRFTILVLSIAKNRCHVLAVHILKTYVNLT